MRNLIIGVVIGVVIMCHPAIQSEYDNWRCSQNKIACLAEDPEIFFGTKTYGTEEIFHRMESEWNESFGAP